MQISQKLVWHAMWPSIVEIWLVQSSHINQDLRSAAKKDHQEADSATVGSLRYAQIFFILVFFQVWFVENFYE